MLEEESSHGPVILRRKRAAAKEKNTCQLFIQTDHLFFKYYGTKEAVVAQVCTHANNMEIWLRSASFSLICRSHNVTGSSCFREKATLRQVRVFTAVAFHYCVWFNDLFLLQISSHVKAIDSIYQSTDFLGIRNISFMVKRIMVS